VSTADAPELLRRFESEPDPRRRLTLLRSLVDAASAGTVSLGSVAVRVSELSGGEADFEARSLLVRLAVQAQLEASGARPVPAAGRAIMPPTAAGGSFLDRYDLVDSGPRDEGGFGEIYQAKRKSDGALVAVKFLKGEKAIDARDRARFDREADTLAYLQSSGGHACVLPYYDHGEHEGRAYLITGWAGRGTVARALRAAAGNLPLSIVQDWLVQVLLGLEFLHGLGVVHRDLKPPNLFLRAGGTGRPARLWIGDFGVALLGDRTRLTVDGSGSPGTPAYAAPEQRAGAPVQDARTDLLAFGVVAFQLITGGRPRPDERSPKAWRSELSDAWEEVVTACMEPRRDRRPASAAEILLRVGVAPRVQTGRFPG